MEALVNFKGEPQELNLPSAPKQYIQYLEEDDRPQVKLDVDTRMVWASASDVSARIRSMTGSSSVWLTIRSAAQQAAQCSVRSC